MKYNILENMEEYLINLPREVGQVIRTFDWLSVISELAKNQDLDEEEEADLAVLVALVLLNNKAPNSLPDEIESTLGLTRTSSEKIAKDIQYKILEPIKEAVERRIREELRHVTPDWTQNLNFILSGGNYLSMLERAKPHKQVDAISNFYNKNQ